VADKAEVRLRLGEGRISGALAAVLGLSSFGGALCFHFPQFLTTGDLRAVYDVDLLREVLYWCIVGASVSGALNFLFEHGRRLAVVGLVSAAGAALLGGPSIESSGAAAAAGAISLDWLILDLLVSALLFVPLEKLLRHREQLVLRQQWWVDLQYFAVTHLVISYVLLVTVNAAPTLFGWAVSDVVQGTVRSWPIWVQFLVAALCADLAQYWVHRLYHTRALWKVHAVHHSAPVMDWLAGSRLHLFEVLATRIAVLTPLFLAGFAEPAIEAYVVLVGVQAVLVHANIGLRFGWLEYLIVTPRYHHWHHSDDRAAADTNFAVHFPVIDLLFGTFHLPRGEWPESYGVIGEDLPEGIVGQHLYPFRQSALR